MAEASDVVVEESEQKQQQQQHWLDLDVIDGMKRPVMDTDVTEQMAQWGCAVPLPCVFF